MFKQLLILIVSLLISHNACALDAEVINAGIGGNNTIQLLGRIEKDVLDKNPDLVVLMVGTNDMLNHNKMLPLDTYFQNLEQIVKQLKEQDIEVVMMSSPPVDSAYLFMRHDRGLFTKAPNEIMADVSLHVKDIAERNETQFIDLFAAFSAHNVPIHDTDLFIRNPKNSGANDGVHFTSLGYHFVASQVYYCLKQNKLLNKGMKIICFGDSLTKGQGAKGAGTNHGQTYPAFLLQMLRADRL